MLYQMGADGWELVNIIEKKPPPEFSENMYTDEYGDGFDIDVGETYIKYHFKRPKSFY